MKKCALPLLSISVILFLLLICYSPSPTHLVKTPLNSAKQQQQPQQQQQLQQLQQLQLEMASNGTKPPSPTPSLTVKSITPPSPMDANDPFLFCVFHTDIYPPAANDKCEAPRRGNGQDFDPNQPYRMYHGDRVPGFPQHPHRGFETITATIEGLVDHSDSLGCGGRYGNGDLQWMTAGKGIVVNYRVIPLPTFETMVLDILVPQPNLFRI